MHTLYAWSLVTHKHTLRQKASWQSLQARSTPDWIECPTPYGQVRLNRIAVARWLQVDADALRADISNSQMVVVLVCVT
jgi:hypothetical protein